MAASEDDQVAFYCKSAGLGLVRVRRVRAVYSG